VVILEFEKNMIGFISTFSSSLAVSGMKILRHLNLLIFIFGCLIVPAFGQLSLDEAVEKALACHPQLAVACSEVAIAQARLIDAGKMENPMFEYQVQSQLLDGPERQGYGYFTFSQKFPITAKLLRQRDFGKAEIRLACAEIHEVERQVIRDVQNYYINAVGAQARLEALNQVVKDAGEYMKLAQSQAAAAKASELDVSAAETEKLLAMETREIIKCDYREALAGLRTTLGMCPEEELTLSQNLAAVTAALRQSVVMRVPAELNRPDIVAAQVKAETACIKEKLARAESREDWEFATSYQTQRSMDEPVGLEREHYLIMGVKIPLPIRKKGQGAIAEASAEKEQAGLEVAALQNLSRTEIAVQIEALCRSQVTIEALETNIQPLLQTRLQKTRDAYSQGLIDFNQVLLLRQQQTRIRERAITAKLELAQGLAKLQYVQGSNPHLNHYDPAACPTYKPGTEPKNAPFALPVLAPGIRATPVEPETPAAPKAKAMPLQRLFKKTPESNPTSP
jgi:outer membrane protein, heavy metal efflux system